MTEELIELTYREPKRSRNYFKKGDEVRVFAYINYWWDSVGTVEKVSGDFVNVSFIVRDGRWQERKFRFGDLVYARRNH